MPTANENDRTIGSSVIVVCTAPVLEMMYEAAQPTTMPMRPPTMPSTIDSIMNCIMMFWNVAPSALRMPISRVRSVTDTIMMFMMPMPPTSSEMLAIAPKRTVIIAVDWLTEAMMLAVFCTWKSFSLSPVMRWRWRRSVVISSCTWSIFCVSVACRLMDWT